MSTIGERLRQLREQRNITLEEAGKAVGKGPQAIYKYERGVVTNIPSNVVEALARLYLTSPAYIMGWKETQTITPLNEAERRIIDMYRMLPTEGQWKLEGYLKGYLEGYLEGKPSAALR